MTQPQTLPVPLPVLYTFRRCPYAIRARLALQQAGVPVQAREIELRAKPAAMLQASPKGTVPVLVLPDGQVLEQSLDIMGWALGQADPDAWLSAAPIEQQLAWVERNDGPFKRLLDRYKYPQRQDPPDQPAAMFEAALALQLRPMEQALQAQAFLCGPRCGLADMALLPFVRQFAAVDPLAFAAAPLPAVHAWLQRLLATPLFEAVMVKQPVWREAEELS